MYKRLFLIIPALFLACSISPLLTDHVDKPWGLDGTFEKTEQVRQDSLGHAWTLYYSDAYGFWEYWIARSDTPASHPAKPFYTAIPADPNYDYTFHIDGKRQLVFDRKEKPYSSKKYFRRELYEPDQDEFIVPLSDLFYDLDADGLTDYAEYALFTDPYNNDTDGDGKADGFDQNPLAAPNDTLTLQQELHKFIIERQLEMYKTKRLIIVEQFDNTPMEYERENGLILSLTSAECDEFINSFGYGVPILTASVKDTLGHYLVNYQFFLEPKLAFGFDAIYDWSSSWQQWVRLQTIYDWESAN